MTKINKKETLLKDHLVSLLQAHLYYLFFIKRSRIGHAVNSNSKFF